MVLTEGRLPRNQVFVHFFGDYNSMQSVFLLSLFFGSNFWPQSQNFKLSVSAAAHKINCLQILFTQIHLEGFQSNAQPNAKTDFYHG